MDVIIVGSGFGGAVTAARLAERGLRVLVLERGPWWGPGGAGQPERDRRGFPRGALGVRKHARNLRWVRGERSGEIRGNVDGLWEWHRFPSADVLTASGVGGGSLVYTSIQEQPEPWFFEAFPPELSADELQPYFDRVRAMLRPVPAPYRPEKEEAFAAAIATTGRREVERTELAIAWGPDPHLSTPQRNAAGVEQGTCVNVGECVLGCPYGAKTSLDLTYLPLAVAQGAQVRPLCEVTAIGRAGRGYRVRYRDHRTGRHHEEAAERLVVAAGTLNTLRLLLAARDRLGSLPELPPRLGFGFTLNGDAVAGQWRTSGLARSDDGPTVTAVHRARDEVGRSRYVVGEAGLPLHGLPIPRWLRPRLQRSSALLAYGRERADARVTLAGRHVTTDVARDHDPEIYAAIEGTMRSVANAYEPSRRVLGCSDHPRGRLLSVHPLGGAAVGRTPAEGVVDHAGEVFGHPGLYIADGSLYPEAPGIPPSMTIAALAERIADLASR